MYRFIILLLTLLALAAIGYFCLQKIQAPAIQADIQSRAADALRSNGIDWADVSVSGRDIVLTGVAPSEDMREAATRFARVDGYNFVENNLSIAGELSGDPVVEPSGETLSHSQAVKNAFSLKISKQKDGMVILDGVLDKTSKADLLAIAKEQYGENKISDNIVVIKGATPSAFISTVANTLEKVNGLTEAEALVTPNNVYLSGQSSSKIMLQQIQHQLQAIIPKSMKSEFNLELTDTVESDTNSPDADAQVAALSAKECQRQFNQALKKRIQFNSSSSVLKKSSYKVLDKVAEISKQCETKQIVVHGHTDATGRNNANRRLSKKRAQAVVNYLAKKDIKESRFKAVGHGSSKPVASNKTERGRARNRRIELSVEVKK
ncbi:MAG: Unknown protein [uncultured Thiotrichaceae bacterium]|uniref:OmpA-like domain-containing protein n=1 Tax=uncultured Thiotrichaceae bacterium TaxID=298394 RepID=A0A6S6UHT3_9GAMM|nr:MAG: Unknown protein [uncultured Thiotrichaceae bacterium]